MTEVELPDGTVLEFPDGMSTAEIQSILQERFGRPERREPGVPPEGYVTNPYTGQMTSREELANNLRERQTRTGSAVAGAGRGATFGANDEIFGGINAALPGAGTPGDRYAFGREYMRAVEDVSREQNPLAFGASEVTGGVASALGYAVPAIAGRGLLGAAGAGAGVGAAEGLAYGFGEGEGGVGERAMNAAKFGLLGGTVGAAAPYAVAGGGAALRALGDPVGGVVASLTNTARQGRANRAITATMERSGRSVDDVQRALSSAAADGQPEYRVVDALGITGQRRLSGLARSGGDSATEIRDFLDSRQLNQPDRVRAFVEDAFSVNNTSRQMTEADLRQLRTQAAEAAYDTARSNARPVDLSNAVDTIDGLLRRDPVLANETSLTRGVTGQRLAALRGRLANGQEQLIDFDSVLDVKIDLGRAMRRNPDVAADMMPVYRALDDALEQSSGAYRKANDDYAAMSGVIDALEEGRQMATGGRAVDNTQRFQGMAQDAPEAFPLSQQDAARIGYGDRAVQRVEGQSGGSNRARNFTSIKAREEADAIANDPDMFRRQIDRENEMFETRNIAAGGSRTADNMEDIADLEAYDAALITNLLRGNVREAATQAGQRGVNALTGVNDATRKRIADALLAKDTRALTAAINEVNEPRVQRQIWNSILRSGALRAGERALDAQ